MNVFQLVLKQMRQRALSTALTLLSVLLGVALAVSIMILRREAGALFGQSEYGYDVIIGPKGSPLQLVLNTVYHIDRSPGTIPYSTYENLVRNPTYKGMVKIAVPYGVGDSYRNHRIVGTTTRLFNRDEQGNPVTYIKYVRKSGEHDEGDTAALAPADAEPLLKSGDAVIDKDAYFGFRPGQQYEFAAGRCFVSDKFEAVVGSDVPAEVALDLNSTFQATHGLPAPNQTPDIHKPKWTVVGVLKPTHTANDRVIFIPLTSFYTIAEHDVGMVAMNALRNKQDMNAALQKLHQQDQQKKPNQPQEEDVEHYTVDDQGRIHLQLPKDIWGISAILVKARSAPMAMGLKYMFQNSPDTAAVSPADVMREFFASFLKGPTMVLLLIALLVTIVAAVSILVSIYNSVSARLREIAILRALGATRTKILSLICLEAGLIGLIGGALGLVVGHLIAGAGSVYLQRLMGEGVNWLTVGREEWGYWTVVVAIALVAGLVPALKAYRTPVATNLVAT